MGLREFDLRPMGPASDSVVHAELHGEIDIANAARFEAAVQELRTGRALVLDLSPASYFDSAGFAILDRLLGDGYLQVVMAPSSIMRRAATLMGVPVHDDPESARAALGPGPADRPG